MRPRRLTKAWQRLDGVEKTAWFLAIVVTAALVLALRNGGTSNPDAAVPPQNASVLPAPRCADAKIPAHPMTPFSCRTARATLTFIAPGAAAAAGSTSLLVLRSTRTRTGLTVDARVGNASVEDRSLRPGTSRVYLNAGGTRREPQLKEAVAVPAGAARAVTLRFRLPRAAGRLQLALNAWAESGVDERRIIVVPLAANAAPRA